MLGRRFLVLALFLVPLLGWSQLANRFDVLIESAPSQHPDLAASTMNRFISDLQRRRSKTASDEHFLRYVFQKSHKTFFHHYKAYSQFPEIFDSGNYDCLSATSFFSVVLDAFGFNYKIVETNYHIFLLVEVNQKQILLESTDKISGFVTQEQSIKNRLAAYHENKLLMAGNADANYYYYDLNLYQEVMPQQLTGLLYFNQAVVAFNNDDLAGSAMKLKKAIRVYNSPRIAEFASMLLSKIANSQMADQEKKALIKPFAYIIKSKAQVVAAR